MGLLGPALLGAIVATGSALSDMQPLSHTDCWALTALWGVVFAGGVTALGLRRRRLARFARRRQAFAALAASLSEGDVLDHDGVIAWLNANWPAPSGHDDLYRGLASAAVATSFQGYGVLVDVEPEGHSDENWTVPPRGLVYLDALVPEHFERTPAARELGAWLAGARYSLECVPGAGLVARAESSALLVFALDPPLLQTPALIARALVSTALVHGIPAPR